MYYQLQIFLISTLLIIGLYEILQLTQLGQILTNAMIILKKKYDNFIWTKKTWKNAYKHQQTF